MVVLAMTPHTPIHPPRIPTTIRICSICTRSDPCALFSPGRSCQCPVWGSWLCLPAGWAVWTDRPQPATAALSWTNRNIALNTKAVLQSCEQINKSLSVWRSGMGGGCCSSRAVMSLGRQGRETGFMGQCKFHITFLKQPIFLWIKMEDVMLDLICKVFVSEVFSLLK